MLNKTLALLLVFSLAFNVAFLAIWAHRKRARAHDPAPQSQQQEEEQEEQGQQQRRRPSGRRGYRRGDELWEKLGVSPEQKQRLDESYSALHRRTEELRQEARTHRERFFKLLESGLPDEAAVLAEQEAIDRIEQQHGRAVIKQMLEMREILTPEQRQAWLQMMREVRERGRRRGRFGGPRPERNTGNGPEPGPDAPEPGAVRPGMGPDRAGPPPMPEGGMP